VYCFFFSTIVFFIFFGLFVIDLDVSKKVEVLGL
jgi:hypothetical protein